MFCCRSTARGKLFHLGNLVFFSHYIRAEFLSQLWHPPPPWVHLAIFIAFFALSSWFGFLHDAVYSFLICIQPDRLMKKNDDDPVQKQAQNENIRPDRADFLDPKCTSTKGSVIKSLSMKWTKKTGRIHHYYSCQLLLIYPYMRPLHEASVLSRSRIGRSRPHHWLKDIYVLQRLEAQKYLLIVYHWHICLSNLIH